MEGKHMGGDRDGVDLGELWRDFLGRGDSRIGSVDSAY